MTKEQIKKLPDGCLIVLIMGKNRNHRHVAIFDKSGWDKEDGTYWYLGRFDPKYIDFPTQEDLVDFEQRQYLTYTQTIKLYKQAFDKTMAAKAKEERK